MISISTTAAVVKVTSSTITQSVSRHDIVMMEPHNDSASLMILFHSLHRQPLHALKTNDIPLASSVIDIDSKASRPSWLQCFCVNVNDNRLGLILFSHHFSALAMWSCASLIFCAAMAHGSADEEDDDDGGPLRGLSWCFLRPHPRHGVFLREPERDAAMHHAHATLYSFICIMDVYNVALTFVCTLIMHIYYAMY